MTFEIIILLIISVLLFFYSILLFMEKVDIHLNNTFLTGEYYEKSPTKAMYRSRARIFFFISIIFFVYAICRINNYYNSGAILLLSIIGFFIYFLIELMINPYKVDK